MTQQEYAAKLEGLTDEEFVTETFEQIDAANQHATYSPADARARQCYTEGERRGQGDLYQAAFDAAYAKARGDHFHRRMFAVLDGAAV